VASAADLRIPLDPGSAEANVVEAALRCIARWGIAKTTLDDIAREAGCSRATVYRLFPGGKASLIETVGRHEIARLLLIVTEQIDQAPDLETMLVDAIDAAGRFFREHAAINMLCRHEPEVLLPIMSFDRLDPVLATTAAFLAPLVARFVDERTAGELVEWGARLVLSYSFEPSPFLDLADPGDVRRLVRTHLLPGARRAAGDVAAAHQMSLTPTP
jgi:AcrR family transcriptional regulator